jgi:Ca2+-binding RTX toxin-like protein
MPNPVNGTIFNDLLDGTFDDDIFSANSGNDILVGSYGFDTLNGGTGNDVADYSGLGATVTLGAFGVVTKSAALGTDTLQSIEAVVGSTLAGDIIDLSGAVSGGGAIVSGAVVNLSAGSVTVNGSGGGLPISLQVKAFENVVGTIYSDKITGNGVANNLNGNAGDDYIDGGDGADLLLGGGGSDSIVGVNGNDTIIGGAGQDKMSGGAGRDLFRWSLTSESQAGTPDYVTDFNPALFDKLDFSSIDAKASTPFANDIFTWIGPALTFSAEGQLRFEYISGNTHIFGNTVGTGTAELEVVLIGTISGLGATPPSFILL